APNTKEIPSSKLQSTARASSLEFGAWSFSGVWSLVFGAFIPSLHQAIPIVPLPRFVAEVFDQPLHVGDAHMKNRSCLRNHVLLDHDAPQVIRAVFERHLADVQSLRHPRALNVRDVIQIN